MKTLTINSIDELPEVAVHISGLLKLNPVAAFYGEMGAGKTTLIREICRQLEVEDNVTSPTFALVNQYETASGEKVNHFDFYRINNIREAFDMGYEDYFYSGEICLIEWPEKIEDILPDNTLKISIEEVKNEEGKRIIKIDI